jgi:Tfp pilus assembly protein PilV
MDEQRGEVHGTVAAVPQDQGLSLVEVLVAIVLLGTTIVATLIALRTTVTGTRIERDHARAGQWLESAATQIRNAPFGECDEVTPGVFESRDDAYDAYQLAVDTADPPVGWDPVQISIDFDIQVWTGTAWAPYTINSACVDDTGPRLQLVTITVESPNREIIETIEVVKNG